VRPTVAAASVNEVAALCASWIAGHLHDAINERGVATVALSGGSSPIPLLRALSKRTLKLDWNVINIFQVDERMAPDGSPDRNSSNLKEFLLGPLHVPASRVHLVPIERNKSAEEISHEYAATIDRLARNGLDVVHLGLGDDGHTASLVPGDPILDESYAHVGATAVYKGFRRVTLTYPALSQTHHVAWFAVGASKANMIGRLQRSDLAIPAGRVRCQDEVIFTDLENA
jgi:6-phosphogluconolactonase